MKNIIKIIFASVFMIAFSSCEKADYTISNSVKYVAFEGSNSSIVENSSEVLKIPVYLTTTDKSMTTSVSFNIEGVGDTPAVEGEDYKVLNADGFTLNGSDIFGTLEIQMINNDTPDGDKHLIITLDGATDNVSLGIGGKEFNQYFVSIIDDEHPLAFILGGYSVEADSYYNGVYPWESSIIAVEGSSDEVDLVGFWGEPDAENMLRAKVNTETGIITIYTGQVLFNSATYGDAYIVKVAINSAGNGLDFFPDENIVGERISDDGVITFTDYGVHVNAGFFDGFKTVVWTKK